jgi:hypothetical protein
MNLEKYVVVAGLPGVHKLVTTRNNGLIIEDRNEGKTRFVAIRQNPVTPLGTIGMYVNTAEGQDTIPLGEVFQKMLDAVGTTPTPAQNEDSASFRAYFSTVVPDHDHDRVHINDIKKCVKWFNFMHQKGMFDEIKAASAAAETTTEQDTESISETPVAE